MAATAQVSSIGFEMYSRFRLQAMHLQPFAMMDPWCCGVVLLPGM